MFVQSYSYNRPFDGSHNVEVALSENEFDTPGIGTSFVPRVTGLYLNCSLCPRQDLTVGVFLGFDQVPEVCELGSAPGGQTGPGAAGKVAANGC